MVKPSNHGVEAKADCTSQSLLPIVDAQFFQQIGTVGLHGSHGQAKTSRRFLIAEPKGIGLQQLAFSRGKWKRLATFIETIRRIIMRKKSCGISGCPKSSDDFKVSAGCVQQSQADQERGL